MGREREGGREGEGEREGGGRREGGTEEEGRGGEGVGRAVIQGRPGRKVNIQTCFR